MQQSYRIAIIEPDQTSGHAWANALRLAAAQHGHHLTVVHARSATATELQLARQPCDLLISPLGDEYLTLMRRLRTRWPHTRILLTHGPHASAGIIHEARLAGYGLAVQPLNPETLIGMVGSILGLALGSNTVVLDDGRPIATVADVQLLLDVLRRETRAQLALFTDYLGNTIAKRGEEDNLDLSSVTSLIAGSFVNSLELGRALRDPNTRHLSVLEGQHFDMYATNAGKQRLLALIFDKAFVAPQLGYVWLQIKRSANQLNDMRLIHSSPGDDFAADLNASLNNEFDRLFGDSLRME